MVKSINWPPGAQRTLLEWVDHHKGPQSALVQNHKQAIGELTKSLRVQYRDNAQFSKGLTVSQVEQRLKYLWRDRLDNFQSSTLDVFYKDGTLALDWDKLSCRPVARAYTDDEIASFKGRSVQSTTTPTDVCGASDDEEATRADKRRRTDHGSVNRSDSARECGEERRRKSPSTDSGKGPQVQVGHSHVSQSPRSIESAAPVSNDATPATSTDNLAPTQQEDPPNRTPADHQNRKGRRVSHNLTDYGNTTLLPVHVRNHSGSGEREGPLFSLDIYGELRYKKPPIPILAKATETAMQNLGHRIQSAVGNYAHALGIPEDQLTILDRRLRYPDECRTLLANMLGLDSFRDADRHSERFLAFHQTKTSLINFLKSFVGSALTGWCLSSSAAEGTYYSNLDGGNVRTVIEQAFTPVLQAEIRQRLWAEHLNSDVVPNLDSEAHHMACMLLAYIDMLIPADPPERRYLRDYDVSYLPRSDPKNTSAQSDAPSPRFKESLERRAFRSELATIFKDGLKWHINTSLRLQENYLVLWPHFLDPYERKSYQVRRARGSDADQSQEHLVCLGLMPLILRSTLSNVDGDEWSEHSLVSKGVVVPL